MHCARLGSGHGDDRLGCNREVLTNLVARPWSLIFVGTAFLELAGVFRFERHGNQWAAFAASSTFIGSLMLTTMIGNYPNWLRSTIDPALSLTADNSAAGAYGLRAALAWCSVGLGLATVYFVMVFRHMRAKVELDNGGGYWTPAEIHGRTTSDTTSCGALDMKKPPQHLNHTKVVTLSIASVIGELLTEEDDELSVEEPLEIRICIPRQGEPLRRSIAVTMRTPGADAELAVGFLFTEGLVRAQDDVVDVDFPATNVAEVALAPSVVFDPSRFERASFVSSSCGVCGKRSMAAVFAAQHYALRRGAPRISVEDDSRAGGRAAIRTNHIRAHRRFACRGLVRDRRSTSPAV